VGAVFEDHIDERHTKKGKTADHPRARHTEHGCGQRVCDLVLDDLWRLPRVLRVDDHLNVGEIGNGVERHALKRIEARKRNEDRCQPYEEDVACGPANDCGDHFGTSCWVKPLRAALRLLSASIKKVAEVTTSSPSLTPSSTST